MYVWVMFVSLTSWLIQVREAVENGLENAVHGKGNDTVQQDQIDYIQRTVCFYVLGLQQGRCRYLHLGKKL